MKNFFANKYIKILLIAELILLIVELGFVFMPTNEYNIGLNDLEYVDGCNVSTNSVTIDETVSKGGYFIYGPSFNIKKGSYDVTINYKTEGYRNYITISGLNQNYNSVLKDDFYLNPSFEEEKFTIWADKNINGFAVTVIYDGTASLSINNIHIKELISGRIYNLLKLLFLIFLVDIVISIVLSAKEGIIDKERIGYIIALLGIAIFSSYPLFNTFLTEGDDIVYHLLRIEGLKDGLLSGQFPVRIHPYQFRGYGYANSLFYGELFLYIPAFLRLCGMPLQTAFKVFIVLVNFATTFITFKCMDSIFKDRRIALLCSFLYVFAPYRLTNIYVRAAVGEFCAMIFWPVIAAGLYHIFADRTDSLKYKYNWMVLTIGYTGLIQTHLLSCEIGAVISIIICLILIKKVFVKERFFEFVKFFGATVLLNAFYLVPFITYMIEGGIAVIDHGSVQTNAIQGNGIYISQLFNLFVNGSGMAYGHGVQAYKELGMYHEMGTTVGVSLLLCAFLFGYVLINNYKDIKNEKYYAITVISWIGGIIAVYMSTSSFPWDSLCRRFGSLVYNLQFPWRMLSVASVFLMIVAGSAFVMAKKYLNIEFYKICLGTVIVTTIISGMYMMYDRLNSSKALYTYDATAFHNHGSGSLNEYLPSNADTDSLDVYEPLTTSNIIVEDYEKKYTNINLNVSEIDGKTGLITVPLLNYLGYSAKDKNGNIIDIHSNDKDILSIIIPANYSGEISIKYTGMWFWHVAEIISLIFVAIFLFFGIKYYKR